MGEGGVWKSPAFPTDPQITLPNHGSAHPRDFPTQKRCSRRPAKPLRCQTRPSSASSHHPPHAPSSPLQPHRTAPSRPSRPMSRFPTRPFDRKLRNTTYHTRARRGRTFGCPPAWNRRRAEKFDGADKQPIAQGCADVGNQRVSKHLQRMWCALQTRSAAMSPTGPTRLGPNGPTENRAKWPY